MPVFVEYLMLGGVNDTVAQARQLAALLDPRVYKVNLIPYNPTGELYRGSSRAAVLAGVILPAPPAAAVTRDTPDPDGHNRSRGRVRVASRRSRRRASG